MARHIRQYTNCLLNIFIQPLISFRRYGYGLAPVPSSKIFEYVFFSLIFGLLHNYFIFLISQVFFSIKTKSTNLKSQFKRSPFFDRGMNNESSISCYLQSMVKSIDGSIHFAITFLYLIRVPEYHHY